MSAFNFIQSIDVTLAGSGISSTATSITVIGLTLPDGTPITTAMLGTAGIGYATIEPETSREENISYTGITDNGSNSYTLTGVTRGLKFTSPYDQDLALRLPHSGSVIMRLTNSAPFYNELAVKRNDETITGDWTFTEKVAVGAVTSSDLGYAATVQYVNDTASFGAPLASNTVIGITKLTTAPADPANPIAVGATDVATSGASVVVRSKSNSTIDDSLLALTTAGDMVYSNGTDLTRLAKGTTGLFLEAGASAPQWGGANLAEANTFFGITNITGAQANTLIGGPQSNADTLHSHYQRYQKVFPNSSTESFNQLDFGGSLGEVFSVQIGFSPDGLDMYVSYGMGTSTTGFNVLRFSLNTDDGTYRYVSRVAGSGFNSGTYLGNIVVGATYIYVIGSTGTDVRIVRYNRDLSGAQVMTISGTALATIEGAACGNDSVIYLHDRDTSATVYQYAISGTTATRGANITLGTAPTVTIYSMAFDGTYIYTHDGTQTVKRFNTSGVLQATSDVMPYRAGNGDDGYAAGNNAGCTRMCGIGPSPIGTALLNAAMVVQEQVSTDLYLSVVIQVVDKP